MGLTTGMADQAPLRGGCRRRSMKHKDLQTWAGQEEQIITGDCKPFIGRLQPHAVHNTDAWRNDLPDQNQRGFFYWTCVPESSRSVHWTEHLISFTFQQPLCNITVPVTTLTLIILIVYMLHLLTSLPILTLSTQEPTPLPEDINLSKERRWSFCTQVFAPHWRVHTETLLRTGVSPNPLKQTDAGVRLEQYRITGLNWIISII